MRTTSPRAGYAMMLVLVSLVLFLALWSVAHRQLAAALRVASVQAKRIQRDEGSVHALARGLALLETGLPPSNPYTGSVNVTTLTGPRSYAVTFTSEGGTNWSVRAAPSLPGDLPPPLPSTFAPSP